KQMWPSVPVPLLSWWESVWVQSGVVILFIVAFAGYGIVALWRRFRHQPPQMVGGKPAQILASTGAVTVLGSLFYLIFLFTDGAHDGAQGPVLIGRPLPWLILQVLAITAVAALIATVVARQRNHKTISRGEHLRFGLLVAGGIV